ncbi:GNAT family N-acetyltransferase [Brevibacillus fulvus]|uniref:Ribosomal-protein-alanine N-acetyltransferase n=1 Tax=Brevibacillus fulvus TaxID=1125967 RepID=A0A939BT99_9BACL|nr:GNAT family protein [Brevibacillus fulvus]MBM7589264.1 ribosomal-protein-alanine N-acetyltransferase [Brevibacillus fulvus]
MLLQEQDIFIRPYELTDVAALLALRLRNRTFLEPFEPVRSDLFFTAEEQQKQVESARADFARGSAFAFAIFLTDNQQMIGRVALSNVVRGAWQNATIGYFLDQQHNGKGYMTQAVKLALRYAFREANLHRVQAAIMPRNLPSIKVVQKAGFRYEGTSLRYLLINGVWEDHHIYALTSEEWDGDESDLSYSI